MIEEQINNGQQMKATAYHASLDDFKAGRSGQFVDTSKSNQPASPNRSLNQRSKNNGPRPSSNGRNFNAGAQNTNRFQKERVGQNKPEMVTFRGSKTLKIVHLGGLQEIGRNMSFLEYGNDIVVIDGGFAFPSDDMPGVDYVIPDVSYLVENRQRIKAIILTHGHMDHIGAIPYLIEKIGNPTIYGANLTIGLLKEKLEEFGLEKRVKTAVINPEEDVLQLGVFKVSFFRVNHNIPDSTGLIIETPVGKVIHTSDFKFDLTPINEPVIDLGKIADIGKSGVLALMIDSTGARNPGYAISETEIKANIRDIFSRAKGRIFVSSFSTLISRMQEVIDVTVEINRQLTVTGRSMIKSIEVAQKLGYLKVPTGLMITPQQSAKLPDDKVVVLSTGTQGEDSSALTRMSRGDHKFFKIRKGDTVILSSSIIPGNETKVVEVYDNLLRAGAKVLDYKQMDIHTSGHAHQEELKTIMRLFNPKYLFPIHGNRYQRVANAELGAKMGIDEEHIIIADDGEVLEFSEAGMQKLAIKVPNSYVLVDGLGVGDVGNIVLRDRQAMAEGGIFTIILTVDHQTSQIVTSPDIISRGFVYMRAAEDLIHRARNEVKNIFRRHVATKRPADWSYLKTILREEMGEFLFSETQRRPMIIPVIIEI